MYNKTNKNSIQNLFDNISKNYDLINTIMSFGLHKIIKSFAVNNLTNKNPQKILDLCTGTGDIAIKLHKKYVDAEIIGIDFSDKMIEIAQKKIKNIKNITIQKMDTTNLNFEPESFDICFLSFGLRNLPDINQALTDIKQVLKPNGVLSILDLGRPNKFIAPIYNFYFYKLIPIIGKIFHKDIIPYKYLVESLKTYPNQKEMIEILKEQGFNRCKNINYLFGTISQQIAYK